MITLSNEDLTITINEAGAELSGITDKSGFNHMWSGDPTWWSGIAPILFPICGGLMNDRYEVEGKTYEMPKHGFAKLCTFTVEEQSADRAVFQLCDSAETRAMYPYAFTLRVTFELQGRTVKITYAITNTNDRTMFCSIGAHEAYATPEGIEDYKVVFEKPEFLRSYALQGNLLEHNYQMIDKNTTELDLKDEYFTIDAMVFKDILSRSVTLVHKHSNRRIRVDFDGFNYFLLWHKHGSPYICLEPWSGIQDPVDSVGKLSIKEGIHAISAGDTLTKVHSITIE